MLCWCQRRAASSLQFGPRVGGVSSGEGDWKGESADWERKVAFGAELGEVGQGIGGMPASYCTGLK